MTTTDTTQATTPHLFRCQTCLETFAGESRVKATCFCGGWLKYLGQVNGGRLIHTFDAPACNYLCTDARGRACNCKCGGANHGSHRTRIVRQDNGTYVAAGRTSTAEECETRRDELKSAQAAVWAKVEARFGAGTRDAFLASTWLPRPTWDACREASYAIQTALKLQTHAGRLARLAKALKAAA